MPSDLKWHGNACQKRLAAELKRRLQAAAMVVQSHATQLIGVESAARRGKGKRRKLIYGANPSKPGEPPHKQTGRLLGSITREVHDTYARVGTNVKYGRWLELGTRFMAARPWLRRALAEKTAEIKAIFQRPMT
jgi:phage gpG-like protein